MIFCVSAVLQFEFGDIVEITPCHFKGTDVTGMFGLLCISSGS